jgi:hypothetical protein
MAGAEYDIRRVVAQLSAAHFRSYLLDHGWEETPCRFVDRLRFESTDESDRYELYLPTSTEVPRYHTHVMRAIYKLCGIEDRDPAEIARDLFAGASVDAAAAGLDSTICVKVRNSASAPLRVQIGPPSREHTMLPGEAIELRCLLSPADALEITHGSQLLDIRASQPK